MLPDRQVVSADPSAERLVRARARQTDVVRIGARDPLPFKSGAFASVSMLDVLEHTWDEQSALLEVRRVLRPGGTLVITVPRRHALSFLDPDEAKLRHPRLHRAVYQARFGHDRYVRRFVDLSDGMRGDLPVERQDHHNYRDEELVRVVTEAGFSVYELDAANLWWRAFDVPRLLLPERFGRLTDKPLAWDGRVFHQANLFLAATRS